MINILLLLLIMIIMIIIVIIIIIIMVSNDNNALEGDITCAGLIVISATYASKQAQALSCCVFETCS